MTEHRTDGGAELEGVIPLVLRGWTARWNGDALQVTTPSRAVVTLPVLRRTSLTPSAAARVIAENAGPTLVIADIIDSGSQDLLADAHLSFWDRRGRLVIQSAEPSVWVDTRTPTHVTGADGPGSDRPITGKGGLAVAVSLCMWPDDPIGVRELARLVEMSASTISDARSRLVDHGLITSSGRPLLPELFWAASDRWVPRWLPTSSMPPNEPEWRQSGHGAAARFGAPTISGIPRVYAPTRRDLDRHLTRHPAKPGSDVTCEVAVAPTPLVWTGSLVDDDPTPGAHSFVHPVVAALDLSRDPRGREVLEGWTEIDTTWLPSVDRVFRGPEPEVVWR